MESEERIAEGARTALEVVRKTAADWRTGLAGLLTIVTAAFALKGPGSISVYSPEFQTLFGALAAVSTISGIAGLWLLLLAAHGNPRQIPASEVRAVGGFHAWNLKRANMARQKLNAGRTLTLICVLLIGASFAVNWYAPTASDRPPAYVRITEDGSAAGESEISRCGILHVADRQGVVFQVPGERDARSVPTERLLSLVLTTSC